LEGVDMASGIISTGPRAFSYTLGAFVVAVAVAASISSTSLPEIVGWAERIFGVTFLAIAGGLVFVTVYSWTRIIEHPGDKVWLETGLQAANGITTLALTYTLLGISLGVGSMADNELSADTVQTVVRNLTAQFSMAFLTTVVGLPLSAVLRTMLLVTHARQQQWKTQTKTEGVS
tara:strand:- start:1222 stop:1746 length:525 start_codon:yes stop_codon:yes gene_type:complete